MADIKALLIAKHDADKAIVDELARRFPLDALVEVWLSCVQNVPSDAVVMGWGADGTVKVRLVYGKEIVRDVPYGAVRPSALSTPAPAPSAPEVKPCANCDGHQTCERCGGSGGGPDLPHRCISCDGTGRCSLCAPAPSTKEDTIEHPCGCYAPDGYVCWKHAAPSAPALRRCEQGGTE